jgi:uncharacterized protein (DUF885 family)
MQKSYISTLLLAAVLLGSCTSQPPAQTQNTQKENNAGVRQEQVQTTESEKANAFFERVYNAQVDRSPMQQTQLGIKKDQDKWDDLSEAAAIEENEIVKANLKYLRDSINFNALDESTKLSYRIFERQAQRTIDEFEYRHYTYPVNQMFGWQSNIPAFLINFHQITNETDARAYIARLSKVNVLMDQVITNLKINEEKGVVLPKFLFPKVLEDSRNVTTGQPFDKSAAVSPLLEDFQKKVTKLQGLSDSQKATLINEASQALTNSFKPGYDKLIAFLNEQEKRATNDEGVWRFPKGAAFYDNALKSTTTTSLTAEEIHQIGLREVERIHGEMRQIMQKVGFKGTLQEFFTFMKEDPRFYYPDTEAARQQYVDSATVIIDHMKSRLDELFITKPKADMIVKRVEPFREKSAGKAFYTRPAPDGSRPGIYYANLYDIKAMPIFEMEALAYHEGIPGHHMQIAIAQELKDIPKFRKFGRFTAFSEGWGLYCELVPKEIGLYKSPYSDFGRLNMEIWRACRLVVDTGIHSKKWTRKQGMDFYRNNTSAAESEIESMVDRHIVMPSQATAYKIGMMKILELREKAKQQLGSRFDIREFHDVVLTNGAVPLSTLEEMVKQWVAAKNKS